MLPDASAAPWRWVREAAVRRRIRNRLWMNSLKHKDY